MNIKSLYILVFCNLFYLLFVTCTGKSRSLFFKGNGRSNQTADIICSGYCEDEQGHLLSLTDRDGKELSYTGVPVLDILNSAGVTTGKQLRGENLTKYVMVKCADGYEVLFSLAELDTAFTNKIIILANELEGKPLPAGKGPFRLVVPGEGRPARSCFQVIELVIRFAKE